MYALLDSGLTTVEKYPLTAPMVRRFADVNDIAVMTSSATDITSISPRIVAVQPNPKPADTEAVDYVEADPVKDGGGIWQQTWTSVPLDAGEQTAKLNGYKRGKWNTVRQKGQALRTGKYVVGPGELDLSGDGFTRLVLMGVVPGARTVPIGQNAQGIETYFNATAQQIADLVADVSTFIDAIAAKESALRDSIAAATTLAELNSIDIDTGWPANS